MSTANIDSLCKSVLDVNRTLRRWYLYGVLLLSIGACSTLNSTDKVTVDTSQSIALLPFENLSATPQAETRFQRLLETQLRHQGIRDVRIYEARQPVTLKALFNADSLMKDATRWADAQGAGYGFTGTVHEWQYKSGADREPVVGVTLSLIDIETGNVLWQANAARSGWGYANLSVIADKVVVDLLEQVSFSTRQRTAQLQYSDR